MHSTPEGYISSVDKSKLNTYDKSMVHCMVSCYTSMVRIKQLHRKLENELNICEKMLSASGVEYDKKWKKL